MKKIFELFWTFFKIGLFTFGGGLAMVPLIQSEVVDRKKWLTDDQMLDMIAIAESTPGVIAVNTATYVGYKISKFWGSLIATIGVVLPSLIIICIIAFFFNDFLEIPIVDAIFRGIRIGVSVLIFNAALKLYKGINKTIVNYGIIIIALALSLLTEMNSIFIILIGAALGLLTQMFFSKEMRKDNDN